jgi:hypothetical protein
MVSTMERVDLNEISFDQAETLALVPGLKAKQLQSWSERGVIDSPNVGKGKKRRYTGLGIIGLRVVIRLVNFGLPPSDGAEIGTQVMERALTLHEEYPAKEGEKHLEWDVIADLLDIYKVGYVLRVDGRHVLLIESAHLGQARLVFPDHYHVLEIDRIILSALNAIYAKLAGEVPLETPLVVGRSDREALEFLEKFKALTSRISAPKVKG